MGAFSGCGFYGANQKEKLMFVKVGKKQLVQKAIEYFSKKEKNSHFVMQLLDDSIKEWEKKL